MSSVVRTGSIRRTAVRWVILCFLVVSAPVYIFLSYPAESSHQLAFAEWVAQVSHLPDMPVTIELREYREGQRTREFVVKGTGTSPQVRRLIELARDAGLFREGWQGEAAGQGSADAGMSRGRIEIMISGSDSRFTFWDSRDEFIRQVQGGMFRLLVEEFSREATAARTAEYRSNHSVQEH